MKTVKPQVVVLGGGYAGLMALARIRQSGLADITLVDAKPQFEQRVRHHQHLVGQHTATIPYARLRGVRFVQARVEQVDTDYRLVYLHGRPEPLPYDFLVYALGSQPDNAAIAGAEQHGITLHGSSNLAGLAMRLRRMAARRQLVSVVGGGLSGIETAAELIDAFPGLRVRLISAKPVGQDLSAIGADYLRAVLAHAGVELVEGRRVKAVLADQLVLADGSAMESALTICLARMRASPLAQQSGFATLADGRIPLAADLTVPGDPRIYVPGDAGCLIQAGGRPLRMSCAVGLPLGAHAGDNVVAAMRGRPAQPFAFGYVFRCISLGRKNGLIQFVDACDQPLEKIWTGRRAASTKEWICRYTVTLPWLELRGLRLLRWPQSTPTQSPAEVLV